MVLLDVMELPKIQMRIIICWYLNMLKMVIYIITYQRILKKSLGKIKLDHFIRFRRVNLYLLIIN